MFDVQQADRNLLASIIRVAGFGTEADELQRGGSEGNAAQWGGELEAIARHRLASVSSASAEDAHSDDRAVDLFAARMKTKLAMAREKGRGGWDDPAQCSISHLRQLLHEHVAKGDPVDVANFCMMLCHYDASTSPEPVPATNQAGEERAAIVSYIRRQSDRGADLGNEKPKGSTARAAFGGGSLALKRVADNIEAGEHVINDNAALATQPATSPMKMAVDRDWLAAKIAADPDAECDAGVMHPEAPQPATSQEGEGVREAMAARDTAQSLVEAWANVCESLEAHLQDRVAMNDEANPAAYLSILRSNMANVQRFSEQVRAARWADYSRQNERIAQLEEALAATPTPPTLSEDLREAAQAQEDAEDLRQDCSDCDGEGMWEHCPSCSMTFGRAIDLRRAALARAKAS